MKPARTTHSNIVCSARIKNPRTAFVLSSVPLWRKNCSYDWPEHYNTS